jgi:hypothetical protein
MTTTATAADQTGTGATAPITRTRALAEALRRFEQLRDERDAINRELETFQADLVEILEESYNGSFRPDPAGKIFTVVRSTTKRLNVDRALVAIRRRRMFNRLTKTVVDEPAFQLLADSGLFPEYAACISREDKRPYIKIS